MPQDKRDTPENNIMRIMRTFTTTTGQTFLPGVQMTVTIDGTFHNDDILVTPIYGGSIRVPQDAAIFFPATN